MTDIPSANVALLIDADNASFQTIDPVLTVLAELGPVNVRRAYGNWTKPALKGWEQVALRHGIEFMHQLDFTKGKNASDMKMTLDAMDLLYGRRITAFGIMSSDSDFTPLVMRLRQEGLPVYGFGTTKAPEAFSQACTRWIDLAALAKQEGVVLAERPAPARKAPGRAAAKPAAAEAKPAAAAPPAPPPPPASKPPVLDEGDPRDAELLKLLLDAYGAAKHDERGFASLSEIGRLAGNRSSFDVRSYGFKRLSDLIEAVPQFLVDRREGGTTFVKRKR